ncbi:MAG: hypothetical protein K2K67_01005 [Treponemataceae bacterium]|nr:hypothetical protein [Treponemataceae bacterium]
MNEKLKQLLHENGLEFYISLFEDERLVEQEDFEELVESDYEKIGITKLGDRKRLLRLFAVKKSSEKNTSSDEVGVTEVVVEDVSTPCEKLPVITEEYGEAGWDWVRTDSDGRHLIYRYGNSSVKYCPNCYKRISAHDTTCPNCGISFLQPVARASSQSSYSSPAYTPSSQPVVINNVVDSERNGSDTTFSRNFNSSFHGILGSTFGALLGAVIVIIILLIILSNESISL